MGQTFMHSPHFTHKARNSGSGSAPGGRISFSEALLAAAEIRNNGAMATPSIEEKIHLRREKSMDLDAAGDARIGNVIAAVGHWEEQE